MSRSQIAYVRSLSEESRKEMMADYQINVFYSDEDGGYIADIPDLKSCSAFGDTPEEAVRQVQIAKKAWLETCRAQLLGAGRKHLKPGHDIILDLVVERAEDDLDRDDSL
jgi:predicted RNase H-like HicB family nuclease